MCSLYHGRSKGTVELITANSSTSQELSPVTESWVYAVIEISERLSTMGIAVNLVTYLGGTMHIPSAESANIVTDFMGTSFMLCLLGGFVADSFLGRYLTIAIFAVVQSMVSLLIRWYI